MPEHLNVQCNAQVGSLRFSIDFTLSSAWTVLFGPSGSGKSSILRLIAGLWRPAASRVQICGEDLSRVPAHGRGVGLVAQQPALFPHMDVLGNIRFGCRHHRECAGFVSEVLELFDLRSLQHARTGRLSGGERQRVALARALAAAPRLLLLDEVFTGMHRIQRDELLQRVRNHCVARGLPVLSVTHDVAEALASADEVVGLQQGHIVRQGTPAEVLSDELEKDLHFTAPTF